MVYGKLVTQGIDTDIKQDFTLSLVCNVYHKRLNLIYGQLQRDAKILHIAYATSFGIIVGMNSFFYYEHY